MTQKTIEDVCKDLRKPSLSLTNRYELLLELQTLTKPRGVFHRTRVHVNNYLTRKQIVTAVEASTRAVIDALQTTNNQNVRSVCQQVLHTLQQICKYTRITKSTEHSLFVGLTKAQSVLG